MGIADFTYHAPADRAEETLYFTISVPELGLQTNPSLELSFPVKRCRRNVHGNSDMGGPISKMMPTRAWDAVGTYDVVGTLEQQDDGSLRGKTTSILLSVRDKDVWVSAILRPWENSEAQ